MVCLVRPVPGHAHRRLDCPAQGPRRSEQAACHMATHGSVGRWVGPRHLLVHRGFRRLMKRQATMRQHGRLLTLLRYAWASPCSLVGVLLAAPILLLGGRAHLHAGVLEVALPGTRRTRLDRGAITLGHVMLGGSEHTPCEL